MTLFKNKYRVESMRLNSWDYTAAGWYFVTIRTQEGKCFFGDVLDGKMHISEIGGIVAKEWQLTEKIRPNVVLDQWVVMPNHIHGIIVIDDNVAASNTAATLNIVAPINAATSPNIVETARRAVSTGSGDKTPPVSTVESSNIVTSPNIVVPTNAATSSNIVETARRAVSTGARQKMPPVFKTGSSRLKPNSLSSIIGQFKSSCTKQIWAAGFRDFAWQTRFYDHIIRDEDSLDRIRQYIMDNPLRWQVDQDNLDNLPPSLK